MTAFQIFLVWLSVYLFMEYSWGTLSYIAFKVAPKENLCKKDVIKAFIIVVLPISIIYLTVSGIRKAVKMYKKLPLVEDIRLQDRKWENDYKKALEEIGD